MIYPKARNMAKVFFEGMIDRNTGLQVPGGNAMQANDRHYYNDMVNYVEFSQVVSQNANEITFYNIGSTTAIINGLPFPPGCGIGFDGNEDEIDDTKYSLKFVPYGGTLPSFAIPGNNCYVIRKCFIK